MKIFQMKRKITKRENILKGYTSTHNVEIVNSFYPELQLKDTESAIKSTIIELLTQLKGFKFVRTLDLNIEVKNKTKCDNFYSSSKAKIIINNNCYCLQAFRTAEKLKCHIKIALKLMVNKLLRCLRRVNILNAKTFEEKLNHYS